MASDSPFLKYRDILVHQSYSAAGALQDFTLSCYNGSLGQFRGDSIGNFDTEHFGIFLELVNHYRRHGENDQHFLEVGAAIWESRRSGAANSLPILQNIAQSNPRNMRTDRSASIGSKWIGWNARLIG